MKTDLKRRIFQEVGAMTADSGFRGNWQRGRFCRIAGDITHIFWLMINNRALGYEISPAIGVRIEQIENIFHCTSGFEPKHQKGTATIGSSIASITGDERYNIHHEDESDMPVTLSKIMHAFETVALPFFDKYSTVASIDALLNDAPTERCPYRSLEWFRCSTGIVAARLNNRPDYDRLAAIYREVMVKDNRGFYLPRFDALVQWIEKNMPRNGALGGR